MSQHLVRPSQTQLVERALSLVQEGTEEFARLNVALATSVGFMGQPERALEAYTRAEAIACELGLRRLELDILSRRQYVIGFQLRLEEAVAIGDRVIELAQELNDPHTESLARFFNHGQFWNGNLEEAEMHALAARALAERTRSPYSIASAAYAQGDVAQVRGDWQAARDALQWGIDSGSPDARVLGMTAAISYQLGDLDAARSALQRTVDFVLATPAGPTIEYAQLTIALARAAWSDDRASDRELFRRAVRGLLESPVPCTPLLRSYALGGLAMLAHVDHDRTNASQVLPHIEALGSLAQEYILQTDHARGLVLEVLDRIDEAIDAIEAGLAWLPPEYRPHRAEAAYDCARIRLQRDAPGDRERARTLIDEALAHAQQLHMRPLVDKLVALKMQDQGISTTGDIYTSIVAVADSVQRERPDITAHAAPDGTVTIMFSDIEDSTVLTERLGDQAWQDLLRHHNALIREQLRAHGGYEVKTMGDGFMVAFQSAKKALDCAIAIQRAFAPQVDVAQPSPAVQPPAAYPVGAQPPAPSTNNNPAATPTTAEPPPAVQPNPDDPSSIVHPPSSIHVRVRIGLHAGEAIKDGDDFYGKNVIMASRVAGKAAGGEILVSSLLRQLVESSVTPQTFAASREVELKGLTGTHTIHTVHWTAAPG
ncbi:MAG: hypothetical protein HY873_05885 [Chloroflexi bacterium]|nr:hypothetical protein [Chloroflexota bacterium]